MEMGGIVMDGVRRRRTEEGERIYANRRKSRRKDGIEGD